jgi:ketosteroid isomerase-like protein
MSCLKALALPLAVLFAARPAAAQTTAQLAEQVRAAETAFAASMADRDFAAFASHVAEESIFFGRSGPTRGKAAVLADWKPFFEGPAAPFSWKPEVVEVLASRALAHSSGPVWDAQGKRIGTFNSIWRREADGRWLVVFDKGCPACECASGS